MVAYRYDGSFDGFLCCVFESYVRREVPVQILPEEEAQVSLYPEKWIETDPGTICQYTGLTDKNGNKIWENDICNRKEKYPEIVTYNKGDWQLDYSYVFGKEMHTDACNLGFYVCERNCVEVIGNIFDNADLLEVER